MPVIEKMANHIDFDPSVYEREGMQWKTNNFWKTVCIRKAMIVRSHGRMAIDRTEVLCSQYKREAGHKQVMQQ